MYCVITRLCAVFCLPPSVYRFTPYTFLPAQTGLLPLRQTMRCLPALFTVSACHASVLFSHDSLPLLPSAMPFLHHFRLDCLRAFLPFIGFYLRFWFTAYLAVSRLLVRACCLPPSACCRLPPFYLRRAVPHSLLLLPFTFASPG